MILKTLATAAAMVAAYPYFRDTVTHRGFVKRGYRVAVLALIVAALVTILLAIWNVDK